MVAGSRREKASRREGQGDRLVMEKGVFPGGLGGVWEERGFGERGNGWARGAREKKDELIPLSRR